MTLRSDFPFFPLEETGFRMNMGVKPLAGLPLLLFDEHQAAELAQKRALLDADYAFCVQWAKDSEPLEQEALQLLQQESPDSRQCCRLAELALRVQEDLLVLRGDEDLSLAGGVLCFPNAWCLPEKLGLPFLRIHNEVPLFEEQLGDMAKRLLQRLEAGRPVWRMNWAIKRTRALALPPTENQRLHRGAGVPAVSEAGNKCWFRVERQTLSRLPQTGGVLFTVRTLQCRVSELSVRQQRMLLHVLETAPAAVLDYKGIAWFAEPLCAWLRQELARPTTPPTPVAL
jgi:dimethylamine monooxygenase subunit A